MSVPRNGHLFIQDVALATNISVESLIPFFEELKSYGLCIETYPTIQIIREYRKRVFEQRCIQIQNEVKSTKEKLPLDISSAEMDYMNKSNGITSNFFINAGGFNITTLIDLESASRTYIFNADTFTLDTTAKEVSFEMEAQGFECN